MPSLSDAAGWAPDSEGSDPSESARLSQSARGRAPWGRMSDGLLAALLLAAFLAGAALTDRMPAPWRWLPMALVCAVFFTGALEFARYDHGHPFLFTWVGFVVAPIGAILGGASWGTRRFYGWPDFGPFPSRVALACAAILFGVLLGAGMQAEDVRVSKERAEALRTQVRAWRDAHGGAWPKALAEAAPDAPASRMGWIAPPRYALALDAPGGASIAFPLSARVRARLTLEGGIWIDEPRVAAAGGA